jgi:hypothetical protein
MKLNQINIMDQIKDQIRYDIYAKIHLSSMYDFNQIIPKSVYNRIYSIRSIVETELWSAIIPKIVNQVNETN